MTARGDFELPRTGDLVNAAELPSSSKPCHRETVPVTHLIKSRSRSNYELAVS